MAGILTALTHFVVADLLSSVCLLAGSLSLIGLSWHGLYAAYKAKKDG